MQDQDMELEAFISRTKNTYSSYNWNEIAKKVVCDKINRMPNEHVEGIVLNTKNYTDAYENIKSIIFMPCDLDSDLRAGTTVACKILGGIELSKNGVTEQRVIKLILMPISKINNDYNWINSIHDLPELQLNSIKYAAITDIGTDAYYGGVNYCDFVEKSQATDFYIKCLDPEID